MKWPDSRSIESNGPMAIHVPKIVESMGSAAVARYVEFFTADDPQPRDESSLHACSAGFFSWCEQHGIDFQDIQPIVIGTYVEYQHSRLAPPTVKLHLAAIKMLYDYL